MKVSLIGPTNVEKLSKIIGKPIEEIEKIARQVGETLAKNDCELVVIFNYSGLIKIVGNSYKQAGGKLEMLYTENDYDWDTDIYMKNLDEADLKVKKPSWHDVLLGLVTDSDVVVCVGLSAGGLAELGYMKWNYQDKKGKVKKLIGVKELLRNDEFPPEISLDMKDIITICSVNDLDQAIKEVDRASQ